MDSIIIKDLEVHYRVGVSPEERRRPQKLLISLDLQHSFASAERSDDLAATIDYAAITSGLGRFGHEREWQLIERLANDIAQWVLAEFRPHQVTVEVKKFIIPETQYVAVRITRPATEN